MENTSASAGETAVGCRVAEHAHDSNEAHGVCVNPLTSDAVAFAKGDRVIVLAED